MMQTRQSQQKGWVGREMTAPPTTRGRKALNITPNSSSSSSSEGEPESCRGGVNLTPPDQRPGRARIRDLKSGREEADTCLRVAARGSTPTTPNANESRASIANQSSSSSSSSNSSSGGEAETRRQWNTGNEMPTPPSKIGWEALSGDDGNSNGSSSGDEKYTRGRLPDELKPAAGFSLDPVAEALATLAATAIRMGDAAAWGVGAGPEARLKKLVDADLPATCRQGTGDKLATHRRDVDDTPTRPKELPTALRRDFIDDDKAKTTPTELANDETPTPSGKSWAQVGNVGPTGGRGGSGEASEPRRSTLASKSKMAKTRKTPSKKHSTVCKHDGCGKGPSYGVAGTVTRQFCAKHAMEGMINVTKPRCGGLGCSKLPSYGFDFNRKAKFCAAHAEEGMVNVTRKHCRFVGGCAKQPSYGVEGTKTAEFCAEHRPDGMVNVSHKKCPYPACSRARSFRYPGANKRGGEVCWQHAGEGMVDVVTKKARGLLGQAQQEPPGPQGGPVVRLPLLRGHGERQQQDVQPRRVLHAADVRPPPPARGAVDDGGEEGGGQRR